MDQYSYKNDTDILKVNVDDIFPVHHSIQYKSGEIIFKQATPSTQLIWIKSGIVKIYKEGIKERTFIVRLYAEGDYIELADLFGNGFHSNTAVTVTPVTIGFIDHMEFRKLLFEDNDLSYMMFSHLNKEILFLKDQLVTRSVKQLPGRIADVLLYFYNINNESLTFDFPLTRVELAHLISSTKESVIRTLGEFKHDKIIDIEGRKIKINSLEIVKTLSLYG